MTTPLEPNRFRREIQLVCNVSSDVSTFFASVRLVLDRNIESDASSWFTFDPATMLPTHYTDFRAFPADDHARFVAHEATAADVGRFVAVARSKPHVDRLVEATGGKPDTSARFREFLQPNGFSQEMRVAFVRDGVCWGGVALYRRDGGPSFSTVDAKAMGGVVEFLGEAMQRALLTGKLNREEDGSRAPGVVVLGPANRVDLITPPAEEWLTGLGVELGDAWTTVLPGEVYAIASHARRTGAGHFDAGPAVAQARTGGGDQVDLHAALLESEPQGPVAVIVEPTRAPRLAPEIAAAYGLSDDEGDAMARLLRGIAPEAVGDQVASVLSKAGVGDAEELAAKVYADHYARRLAAGQPVGPDGWFEGPPPTPEAEVNEPVEGDTESDGHRDVDGG
jgi:hypothetical protein